MMWNGFGYEINSISNMNWNIGTTLGGAWNLISSRSNSFRNIANNSAPIGNIGSSGLGGRLNWSKYTLHDQNEKVNVSSWLYYVIVKPERETISYD